MTILKIWREQPGKFFSLQTKSGGGNWKDHFFSPDEFGGIRQFLKDHADDDIYFCPHGFNRRSRSKTEAVIPNLLWADLDFADPRKDEAFHGLKPTVCIESSPGRFVGLWSLRGPMTEELNRRLTYHLGADRGGWDLTQALRYPGTTNYKYTSQPRVRTLWDDGPVYSLKRINKYLPEEELQELSGEDLNPSEVFAAYESKLPRWVRRELLAKRITGRVDRSEMLWKLENGCVEAGMSLDEAFAVLKRSPWNKFAGRRNEDEQLRRELSKIVEHHFRQQPAGAEKLKRGSDEDESFAEREAKPRFIFKPMDEIEQEDIDWVWYPYLARKTLSILEGDPGLGKSYLSMIVCASIATNKRLPTPKKGMGFQSGAVVYFDIENNAGSVTKARLSYNGFNKLGNYYPVEQAFSIEDEEANSIIYEHLEMIRPVVIVFDTLNTYIGKADTHKASESTQAMNFFGELAKHFDCAVMVLRHLTKGGGGSAITRGQGSIAFAGSARIVMTVGVHPDDSETRVMAQAKNNLAPEARGLTFNIEARDKGNSEFIWGEYTELNADQILAASHDARTKGSKGNHVQDAMEFLEKTLNGVPFDVAKLYRMAEKRSISSKILDRAASKMNIIRKAKGGSETWLINKEAPDEDD